MLIKFEEEFDKEFSLCSSAVDCEGDFRPLDVSLPVIKQFITSLLQKQEEETRKEERKRITDILGFVKVLEGKIFQQQEEIKNNRQDEGKI